MKKITIIAALAALAFTACEKNGQTPVSGTSEVRFVMDEVVTRVTTAGTVTTFDEDDQIAITSEGLYEDIANEKYTYKSTGLDGKSVLFKETGEASFVAHYPSSLNNEDGSIEMTVPAVQTADNFHDNMFMVATAEGSATDNVVTLQFAHQLAWVKVVLEGIDGTAVTLHGVKPTVTWTSSALEASGTGTDITTWKQTGQEYWALVPAQTIYASTKLITVETATTAYEYTLASELTLTTAKVKTITLSLDPRTGLTQASFSVDSVNDIEWTDDDTKLEDFVTEKPAEPVVLISKEEGNFENVTLNTTVSSISSVSSVGWTPVMNGTDRGTITYNANENSMEIYSDASKSGNTWHNLALVYRTNTVVESGQKYKLSFEYKASALTYGDANAPSQLYIRLMQPDVEPSNTNIRWAKDLYPTPTSNDSYSTYSNDLTILDDAVVSGSPTSSTTLDNGILILFGAKASDGITYSIKNVTLEQVIE